MPAIGDDSVPWQNSVSRLARMVIQRNNLGLANPVTVYLAQVLDRLLHAIARQTNVIDRDELVLVVDQFAVLLLVHRFDRVPVGVEDLRRVFEFVEQVVDPVFVEVFMDDEVQDRVIQRFVEAIRIFCEATLDERHDQRQEVVRQARALGDKGCLLYTSDAADE